MKPIALGSLDIRGCGQGWAVFDGDAQLTRTYSCSYSAAGAATRLERQSREQARACLTCGETFVSEGPHNRLCSRCRHRSEGLI